MLWTVIAEDTKTKIRTQWTANVLIHAVGFFNRGYIPDIPGLSDFKGKSWHTFDWREDVSLEGKRVAIIGTGSSAAQIIPDIQPIVKSLTVYNRSNTYCIPRFDREYSATTRWIFAYVPLVLWIYATVLYYIMEYAGSWLSTPSAG